MKKRTVIIILAVILVVIGIIVSFNVPNIHIFDRDPDDYGW